MSNIHTYDSDSVVRSYSIAEDLQKPEETILARYKDKLKEMEMLDIGVGGGRTTIYFARLVKGYIGVDYAEQMIEACKKRFFKEENVAFEVADARALNNFKDNSFDFVLFSFNGIDYIDHEDRNTALKEIRRVLRENGVFVFSTHNLDAISDIYAVQFTKNPMKLAWRILRSCILFLLNGPPARLKRKSWATVIDGDERFRLKAHYISPGYQVQQLTDLNYKDIHLFSLATGQEINATDSEVKDDPWIYYTCSV